MYRTTLCLTLVWLVAASASCGPQNQGPELPHAYGAQGFPMPERSTASLGARRPEDVWKPAAQHRRPVQVVAQTPVGRAGGQKSISVLFNQPMVRLGPARSKIRDPKRFPIRIQPAVRASYRWVNGDTLKVDVHGDFQPATRYRVTIPAGTRSLGGGKLAKAVQWHFDTTLPFPSVGWFHGDALRAGRVRPRGDDLLVATNLPTDPAALRKQVRVTVAAKAHAFELSRLSEKNNTFVVRLRGPLPVGAQVVLKVLPGFRSLAGPLPSKRSTQAKFRVRRRLAVTAHCGGPQRKPGKRCSPMAGDYDQGIALHFTEPVCKKQLLGRLRITPRIPKLAKHLEQRDSVSVHGKQDCARIHRVNHTLRGYTTYRVTLQPGARDVFGRKLSKSFTTRFQTGGFPSGIFLRGVATRQPYDDEKVTQQGEVLEPRLPYRFQTMNVREVQLQVHHYSAAEAIRFHRCRAKHSLVQWPDRCPSPTVTKRRLRFPKAPDRLKTRTLKLPAGQNMLVFTSPQVTDHKGRPVRFQTTVLRTDLGVHGRVSAFGVTGWVTSLSTGRPLRGVAVEVYDAKGRRRGKARTDGGGFAFLSRKSLGGLLGDAGPPELFLIARRGRDEALLSLMPDAGSDAGHYGVRAGAGEHVGSDPHGYEAWLGRTLHHAGYVGTERGIYRPGDPVHVHGAVRSFRVWSQVDLAVKKATVRLLGPSRTVLATREVNLDSRGVFTTRLRLPASGRLGRYAVEVRVASKLLGSQILRVEEFRAPRFEFSLAMPSVAPLDTPLPISLRGRYFSGAPLTGAAYYLQLRRSPMQGGAGKKLPGFVGGCSTARFGKGFWKKTLRKAVFPVGSATTEKITLGGPDASRCPFMLRLQAFVFSPDGRVVSKSRLAYQLPGDLRVVSKVEGAVRGGLRLKLMVLGRKGGPVAGRTVQLAVHATDKALPTSANRVLSKKLVVGKSGTTVTVPWRGKLTMMHLFAWVADGQGRQAWHRRDLVRPGPTPRVVRRRPRVTPAPEPAELSIAADKMRYAPGDLARITVTRGQARGQAVLVVERERVFSKHTLRFNRKGRAVVSLRVPKEFAPAVWVRVLVQPRGRKWSKECAPVETASMALDVKVDRYKLGVTLKTDRKVYRPRQRVQVQIAVRDHKKRPTPATVVLMAVDESVLRLTGYTLGNPLWALFKAPPRGVFAEDIRRRLLPLKINVVHRDYSLPLGKRPRVFMGSSGRRGGSGGGRSRYLTGSASSSNARAVFRAAAWHGRVTTDKNGRATVTFTLPDNLTRFRLMSFAVASGRRAGVGSSSLRVSSPVSLMAELPRFARVGDVFKAGASVTSQSLPAGQARVTAHVQGRALTLDSPAEQRVKIGRGGASQLRWKFQARGVGTVKITFSSELRAGGKTYSDKVVRQLRISRPTVSESASLSGQTQGAILHGVDPLSSLRPDFGGLKVSLASTALVGVESGMRKLIDYPYGCMEQRGSRLVAILGGLVLAKRFQFELSRMSVVYLRKGLRELLAMQRADGGFGFWPSSHRSHLWATAYALIVLHRVKLAEPVTSITVDRAIIQKATHFLQRKIGWRRIKKRSWHWAQQALIAYALALHGRDVSTIAKRLYAHRQGQALFGRAMLLAAMGLLKPSKHFKKRDQAYADLLTRVGQNLQIDGNRAFVSEHLGADYHLLMSSSTRSTAMVLLTLLRAKPSHVLIPRLVRWFLAPRKGALYTNTQEAAWALMALWDYALIREKAAPDFEAGVWVGGRRVIKTFFRGHSNKPKRFSLPMKQLTGAAAGKARAMVFAKRGRGTLYYTARLRYARKALPRRPLDHGFRVRKTVQVVDALRGVSRGRKPKLGDTVLVTLRVQTTERRTYVALEDPLPAGLEALDTSLRTSHYVPAAKLLRKGSTYDYRELRDDRVLFFRDLLPKGKYVFRYLARINRRGRFLAPPTTVHQMYRPEVYGYTGATRVTYR